MAVDRYLIKMKATHSITMCRVDYDKIYFFLNKNLHYANKDIKR